MPTDKKKLIGIVIAVVVVIFVVAAALLIKRSPNTYGPGGTGGGKPVAPKPSGPVTREAAPANVVVPSQGAKDVPKNVAVPNVVAPGSASGDTSYRSFSVKVDGNQFMPSTVVVKKGDTIDLNFTAVDKDYDFTQPDFGFKVPLPKGASKRIQFGGTVAGKFTFYCASCGGPEKGPIGYVVIAP